jgi:Ni/Fe-hydrogenase subunit HybB-like protein
MGLAAVTIEGSVTSLALRRPLEREILAKLMKVGQALAVVYLIARFADLAVRGRLSLVVEPRLLTGLFWLEIALFVAPVGLLLGKAGARPKRFFAAALLLALGGIMYRLDAYLVAYDTGAGWHYFPSMGELLVTLGLISAEILGFIVAIRILPVLPRASQPVAA